MSDEAVKAAEAPEEKPVAVEAPKEVSADVVPPPHAVEAPTEAAASAPAEEPVANTEDVSYQSVEKEGTVTAIWEMQGQRHLRTIDPRSIEGKQILALFETAG